MRLAAFLALLTLTLSGCGPTEREAGQSVLLTAPLITLVGGLLAALYAHHWRPLASGLRFRKNPTAVLVSLQALVCAGAVVYGPAVEDDYVLFALWLVGSSYLAVLFAAMRLGVVLGLRRHYSWVPLLPWLLFYGPALWLGYTGSEVHEASDLVLFFWIVPGYMGFVAAPLLVVFSAELAVRHRRRARRVRQESLPRPLPDARLL